MFSALPNLESSLGRVFSSDVNVSCVLDNATSMSVMQHKHQQYGGESKERKRPMSMLSEDDVHRVNR